LETCIELITLPEINRVEIRKKEIDIVLKDTVVAAPIVAETNRPTSTHQIIEKMDVDAACNQPVVLCSIETTEKDTTVDVDVGQSITVTKIKSRCPRQFVKFISNLEEEIATTYRIE
jgi:hypothetical protein